MGKTGGGRGTNQYKVKGRSIAHDGSTSGGTTQSDAGFDLQAAESASRPHAPDNPFNLINRAPEGFREALGPRPGVPGGARDVSHKAISEYLDRADDLAVTSADNMAHFAETALEDGDIASAEDAMNQATVYMRLHTAINGLRKQSTTRP